MVEETVRRSRVRMTKDQVADEETVSNESGRP